jgi:GNAT superfamily N-acetyltransferase
MLYVIDLYVREQWRRQGVGRALMEEVVQVCRRLGGSQLFWSVYVRNEVAFASTRAWAQGTPKILSSCGWMYSISRSKIECGFVRHVGVPNSSKIGSTEFRKEV